MKNNSISCLKVYLIQRGVTQSKLSKDTGLSRSTVSNLINKSIASKSVRMLVRLYLNKELKVNLEQKDFDDLCDTDFWAIGDKFWDKVGYPKLRNPLK